MKKYNEILSKIKKYISNLKLDIRNIDKENMVSFIKYRKYLISIISLIVVFVIIFYGDAMVTSKEELLNNFKISMTKGNSNKISGDVLIADEKVSRRELEPLIKYYNADNSKIIKVVNELKTTGKSGIFTIKIKKKMFWEDYSLDVSTVALKVNCNFKEGKIFIDDKELNNTNVKKALIPGLYSVRVEINTSYGLVEKEMQVSLMQNEVVNMDLSAINLNITSNFNDAKVYINNEYINKNVSEIADYGPIPTNKDIEIQLEREFPWGVIRSEKVKITDFANIKLDINMLNKELTTQIESDINKFYTSVFEALNKKDPNLILLTNEEIQNKIYNEMNKNSFIFKNNYEVSDLETKIENSEFKYEDNIYKAQMVIKIKYSVYKKMIPFSKSEEEKMFLTNMELVGEDWVVKEFQRFNLE